MSDRRDPAKLSYYADALRTARMLVEDGLLLAPGADHEAAIDLIMRGLLDAWEAGVKERHTQLRALTGRAQAVIDAAYARTHKPEDHEYSCECEDCDRLNERLDAAVIEYGADPTAHVVSSSGTVVAHTSCVGCADLSAPLYATPTCMNCAGFSNWHEKDDGR